MVSGPQKSGAFTALGVAALGIVWVAAAGRLLLGFAGNHGVLFDGLAGLCSHIPIGFHGSLFGRLLAAGRSIYPEATPELIGSFITGEPFVEGLSRNRHLLTGLLAWLTVVFFMRLYERFTRNYS